MTGHWSLVKNNILLFVVPFKSYVINSVGDLCFGCDFIRSVGCCSAKHFHGVVILKGVETDGNRTIVVTIILTLPELEQDN